MFVPVKIAYRELLWPTATIALIVCNVLAFLAQQLMSPGFQYQLMLRPDHIDPIAWLTSMFMHLDWMHLIVNMLFLWPFGMYLESRVGWARMLALYLMCGIAASAVFFALHYGERTAMVGASGAVAGLMGLCVIAAPLGRLHIVPVHPVMLLMAYANNRRFTIHMPLVSWILLWLMAQVAYYWIGVGGIAFEAHFGGIAAGATLGLLMRMRMLPIELTGPATEEELRQGKREQLLHTVVEAWEHKTATTSPPVDYMAARAPNWTSKPFKAPPASTLDLEDPTP